jgi:hypothetical protein
MDGKKFMRKKILISVILILINTPKINSQTSSTSVERTYDSLQNIMVKKSEMKIMDLVSLVKYAQGAVVFNSLYAYLKFLKPSQRKIYLSQIVELTGHFFIDDSAADLAIRESGLSDTCTACLILKEGVYETQLQKIAELPESELESSFKLLLTLFSIGYQGGYQKHKNAPTKFWYWDYSEIENTYKYIELDYNQYVLLDEILRP